jgi:hypothetical protein
MKLAIIRTFKSVLLLFLLAQCIVVFSQSTLKSNTTAPFKMISFTVELDYNNIILKWTKVPEVVIPSFYIERSEDGKKYKNAGLVFADEKNTKSNFQFKDEKVKSETKMVFYRLRYTDEVGRIYYSDIRMIRLETEQGTLTLTCFPNPVQDELRLTFPKDWLGKKIQLQLISGNGIIIENLQINNAAQTESISTLNLSKGIYFLRAISANKINQTTLIKS